MTDETTATTPATPDNLTDLRNAHSDGLPYVALWPVDGFTAAWHADQLAAGKRIMPSVRLPDPDYWQANAPERLDAIALGKIAAANVPVVLRTNNIRDAIAKSKRNRSTDPAVAATQGAVYSIETDANGVKTAYQEPFCDCLATSAFWQNEGSLWGMTPYFQKLKEFVPTPPELFILENNEGCAYEQLWKYLIYGGALKPPAGVQPIDTIGQCSWRMANWIQSQTGGTVTPDVVTRQIQSAMVRQYNAFYDGFLMRCQPVTPLKTAGYGGMVLTNVMVEWPWTGGYSAATNRYDAISPSWYFNSPTFGDFTNCRLACVTNAVPAWEQTEYHNDSSWRELSIQITDGAALEGALDGKHKAITPELWGGYCEYLLWAMQSSDHTAVVLRHYEGSFTPPTKLVFMQDTSKLTGDALAKAQTANLVMSANLVKAGVPQLATATIGDYVLAEESACSNICETAILRDFWTKGTPIVTAIKPPTDIAQAALKWPAYPLADDADNRGRLLPCDANDPPENWRYIIDGQSYTGTVKVWACASKHADGRVLVYAWTPCQLGVVNVTVPGVGSVPIDLTGKQSAYAIYGPVQPWGWRQL